MKKLMLVCVLLMVGCAGIVKTTTTTTVKEKDKTTITESKSYARQPRYPLGGASASTGTNGTTSASVSGAQSQAGIEREKWKGIGNIVIYLLCGVLVLFGAAIMYAGEKLGLTRKECNRDGIICIGAGLGMFAVMNWVDASAPIMKWAIPAVFVALIGFFGFMYWRKNSKTKLTLPVKL